MRRGGMKIGRRRGRWMEGRGKKGRYLKVGGR